MKIRVKVHFYNENFIKARHIQGLTMERLSYLSGISLGILYAYQGFRRYPKNPEVIRRLEKVLHCSFEVLFPKEYRLAVDRQLGRPVIATREISYAQIQKFEVPRLPSPADMIIERDMKDVACKLLDTLTPREQLIIKCRCGMEDGEVNTYEKTGRKIRVSKERVRQIEKKAIRKLRWRAKKYMKEVGYGSDKIERILRSP